GWRERAGERRAGNRRDDQRPGPRPGSKEAVRPGRRHSEPSLASPARPRVPWPMILLIKSWRPKLAAAADAIAAAYRCAHGPRHVIGGPHNGLSGDIE